MQDNRRILPGRIVEQGRPSSVADRTDDDERALAERMMEDFFEKYPLSARFVAAIIEKLDTIEISAGEVHQLLELTHRYPAFVQLVVDLVGAMGDDLASMDMLQREIDALMQTRNAGEG